MWGSDKNLEELGAQIDKKKKKTGSKNKEENKGVEQYLVLVDHHGEV